MLQIVAQRNLNYLYLGEQELLKFEDDVINSLLRAPTKQDLIRKGKISHHRQQKIVGGSPVQYGKEAPWTVR